MSYLPKFLINKEELDAAIENDELYEYERDESQTAANIISKAFFDDVYIKGDDYYFYSTEFSYQAEALRDYLNEFDVEYFIFGA